MALVSLPLILSSVGPEEDEGATACLIKILMDQAPGVIDIIPMEDVIRATKDACIYDDILALPNAFDHVLSAFRENYQFCKIPCSISSYGRLA